MAQAQGHFIIEYDDDTTGVGVRAAVPAREATFISLDLPADVYIKPVFSVLDRNGEEEEQLELPEWSLGFVGIADAVGSEAHRITINELMKLSGVGGGLTEIPVRSLVSPAAKWTVLPVWWSYDKHPPITFKNEIKISVTGTTVVRMVLRLIPRSHLRNF